MTVISYQPYDTNYVDTVEVDEIHCLTPTSKGGTFITMKNGEVLVSTLDFDIMEQKIEHAKRYIKFVVYRYMENVVVTTRDLEATMLEACERENIDLSKFIRSEVEGLGVTNGSFI